MVKAKRWFAWAILSIFVAGLFSIPGSVMAWEPKKPVEFVIMAGQGGGADRLARLIQSIIAKNKFSPQPFIPINKGGGSGAEALRYLQDKKGDPHVVMATLNSYYTTPLRSNIGVDIKDFTPVARLALDTFLLWVNSESSIKSVDEYLAEVKKAGGKWKMGGTGTGQEDSLVTGMLEGRFGVKHTYIPFKGGGTVAKNLIGNHIDSTVNNPSEQMGFFQAGKSRPIAAFTPERLEAFPDVPTMGELGHNNMVYFMQRSVIAPPGIPSDVQDFYVGVFKKVNDSAEWIKYTNDKSLGRAWLTGNDLTDFFLKEREVHRKLLMDAGEIK
ncbi:MAG: tripartite tricarboxylate transporter substrate binding protein [SAR324 cluster bacterium]|nr:tripartite tricarboxylate transporter substrate binding protein [SAR324 cluster bacterium]